MADHLETSWAAMDSAMAETGIFVSLPGWAEVWFPIEKRDPMRRIGRMGSLGFGRMVGLVVICPLKRGCANCSRLSVGT